MMRALTIAKYAKPLALKDMPIPKPAADQVLVKMKASPINPSDLGFTHGVYGAKRPTTFPIVPGLEGTGTVHELGSGAPRELLGKNVSFFLDSHNPKFHGCWCEYAPVNAKDLIVLRPGTDYKHAACAIVNPYTALSFIRIAKEAKSRAIIHTAAASAVGRMLVHLGQAHSIEILNIVRNKHEEDVLKEIKAKHILNFTEGDFDKQLKEKIEVVSTQ
eukprot:TRINITY_DN14669_c0_g1_i11.p2 TRINITY_DN14669_c0_g1~~TRINITY_DN14669_c0_g1_i11.p2  ORF type:complete len:217 (+),score=60.07 TRINITY_DN14669_c0_g1_i11:113-763(+)